MRNSRAGIYKIRHSLLLVRKTTTTTYMFTQAITMSIKTFVAFMLAIATDAHTHFKYPLVFHFTPI